MRAKVSTREFSLALDAAKAYVEGCITGPMALTASKRFVSALRWASGQAVTYVNSTISEAQLHAFDIGGKSISNDSDSWLERQVIAALGQRQGFVLVEDWQLRPDHCVIKDLALPVAFFQNEVYYIVAPGSSGFDLATLNTCPCFIGFVVAAPTPNVGTQLTTTQLDALATSVVAVYCGAYDGESYVFVRF